MTSSGDRIYIGTHLALITEQNHSGPGAFVRGVEFDGVTGMTGNEDRDWPVLDPAFGLAKRLGCDGIWFRHRSGVEFVTQSAESARRCRELVGQRDGDQPAPIRLERAASSALRPVARPAPRGPRR